MKKKLFIILFGLLLFGKIYSKENIILKCSTDDVKLTNYLMKNNSPLVFVGNDYNTYYIWNNDNKCINASIQDLLDLYNQEYEEKNILLDNNTRLMILNKYKFKTTNGYYLDKSEYETKKEYYYYDEEYNSIKLIEENKNVDRYVKGYFRHISSEVIDEKKEYYFLSDPNNSIFELINNEEIQNINILNVYELINLDDSLISEEKYSMDNMLIEKFINENYKDKEIPEYDLIVINKKLYFNLVYKNSEGKIMRSFLYDSDGKLMDEYNNKIFKVLNKNVLIFDRNYKQYQVIDDNFKVINEFEFDKSQVFNNAYSIDNGIYISLSDEVITRTYFYENNSTNIYLYLIICVGVLVLGGLMYFFMLKRK